MYLIDKSRKEPNREQAATIIYFMKRGAITERAIAADAGVSGSMVRQVIYGLKTSARVQKLIATKLGFDTWTELTTVRRGIVA